MRQCAMRRCTIRQCARTHVQVQVYDLAGLKLNHVVGEAVGLFQVRGGDCGSHACLIAPLKSHQATPSDTK